MPRRQRNEEPEDSGEREESTRSEGVQTRSGVLRASRAAAAPASKLRGGEAAQGGAEDGARVHRKKRKLFHGCFSTDHVQQVISTFGENKLSILHRIGLGSLTHLKPSMNHSRALVSWLLKKIDCTKMCLTLDKGDEIQLSDQSVHHILGVRCEGNNISITSHLTEETKEKIHQIFSTESLDTLPTIEDAKKILVADYGDKMSSEEENKFAVALASFVCGYMFGPPVRAAEVPRNVLGFISNPENLQNCNWASYILSMVQTSASRLQKNVGIGGGAENQPHSLLLGGCWLYLELLYLDSIDFGILNIPLSWFPRVRVYDKHTIQDFIYMDEEPKKSGKFGHKQRRKPCAKDDVAEGGWQTTTSGVRVQVGLKSGKMDDALHNKVVGDIIVERFGKIMEWVDEAKRVAYEEARKQFELHECNLKNVFGDLENKLIEERRQLLVYASNYQTKLSMNEKNKGANDGTGDSGNDTTSVPAATTPDTICETQEVATRNTRSSNPGESVDQSLEAGLTDEVGEDAPGTSLAGANGGTGDSGNDTTSVPAATTMDNICETQGVATRNTGSCNPEESVHPSLEAGLTDEVGEDAPVDSGAHENTNGGRGEDGGDEISLQFSMMMNDVCETEATRKSIPDQDIDEGGSHRAQQATHCTGLADLVRDTSMEELDKLLEQEIRLPDPVSGNIHTDGPNGNMSILEELLDGSRGCTNQDAPPETLYSWSTPCTMNSSAGEALYDATPPGVQGDDIPTNEAARYDLTPKVAETPIIGQITSGLHLKRPRIKQGARKSNRKVCSSKRVCREALIEGSTDMVTGAEEDIDAGNQPVRVSENEVPRSRHVGQRCVQSPPFTIATRYHQMGSRKIDPKYRSVMKDGGPHMQSYWVILKHPREIKLAGTILQEEFSKNVHITRDTFSAIVRLLQCQQTALYNKRAPNRNQWKHFIDPVFAEAAIGNKDFRVTTEIRGMFLGPHVGSKFEHCRLVMVPSNARGYWCLYIWDMEEHKVHIIDPCSAGVPLVELKRRHEGYVHDLHEALNTCKNEMFTGWDDNFDDYQCINVKGAYPTTKREGDSGVYVVHYMCWFDGEKVVYKIDEKDAWRIRKWLLIDLLTMNENAGEVPAYIKQVVVLDE